MICFFVTETNKFGLDINFIFILMEIIKLINILFNKIIF